MWYVFGSLFFVMLASRDAWSWFILSYPCITKKDEKKFTERVSVEIFSLLRISCFTNIFGNIILKSKFNQNKLFATTV